MSNWCNIDIKPNIVWLTALITILTASRKLIWNTTLLVLQCWHPISAAVKLYYKASSHYSNTQNTKNLCRNLCSSRLKSDASLCYTTLYFLSTKCQRFHFIHLNYLSFGFFAKTWKNSWKLMFTIPDWNSTLPVENSPKTPHGIRIHWNLPVGQKFTWTHCISAKPALAAVTNSSGPVANMHFFWMSLFIKGQSKPTEEWNRKWHSIVGIHLAQLSSVATFGIL